MLKWGTAFCVMARLLMLPFNPKALLCAFAELICRYISGHRQRRVGVHSAPFPIRHPTGAYEQHAARMQTWRACASKGTQPL